MKIILVDDNDTFRGSLKTFLEGHLNYEVIAEYSDGKQFIDAAKYKADIILMDINMPEINGLKATKVTCWENHETKIIAVSQYNDNVDIKQLIGVGFRGFVSKMNLFRDLENAIIAVNKGGYFFPEELSVGLSNSF